MRGIISVPIALSNLTLTGVKAFAGHGFVWIANSSVFWQLIPMTQHFREPFFSLKKLALLTAVLSATYARAAESQSVVVGNVRVQLLSDSLVRLELKGPEGFENRKTFHVVNRDWPGAAFSVKTNSGVVEIRAADYSVQVPQNAASLDGARVLSPDGAELYHYDGNLENSRWLPSPSDKPQVWSFADTPRIVPPPWGLTPAPSDSKSPQTSGWDVGNDAPDVYVFIPRGNYFTLRKDFLKLTGPTEMPPLFALGAFDSRWYDYSEATALKQIHDYRARKIPLDVLVIDTGWRQGASTGYQPNTNLFPNLPRFFQEAHARHVHIMFNDHPEPVAKTALDPKELNYRFAGLSGLLNEGLDFWWYDRNWSVALKTPAPNLKKEVWGMRLYHDITQRVRPKMRPLIMANVDGIDNGIRKRPMDVASHRFPIQWTGDIGPSYEFLRRAVENAVSSGVQSLFPYESDDLGGHVADPTPVQYIRWIEYGALSPIYRPHCTHNHERMPWTFGPEAERVARRFLDLRYRLLPVFYAAAHENYETGEPLLRRLDLYYPQFTEASRDDEYLLGRYILVAPVLQGELAKSPTAPRVAWIPPGDWIDAWNGEIVSGPVTVTNQVPLDQIPIWIKAGAVLPLAPQMQYTGEKPWSPITLDLYPSATETNHATLYEDDTRTTAYQRGQFRNTDIAMSADETDKIVRVEIGAAVGNFRGELKKRAWILRIHPPTDWVKNMTPTRFEINGRKVSVPIRRLARNGTAMPFGDEIGAPDADVFEINLPASSVGKSQDVEVIFSPMS
jgi:alpha-glucosidase